MSLQVFSLVLGIICLGHATVASVSVELGGECVGSASIGGVTLSVIPCREVVVPDKWVYVPANASKSYPDCCAHAVPPLEIVPDVLDELRTSETLDITYEDCVKVDLGNELTPTQVKSEPTVIYKADPTAFYTLCMTDPDAPSRSEPTLREFRHWLVGNIPGRAVSEGEILTEYVGSAAPRTSGLHRYTFLLYKQPGKLVFDETRVNKTTLAGRTSFSIQTFAEKYNMGEPKAFNIFQAQWDEYVPILHQQLGYVDTS